MHPVLRKIWLHLGMPTPKLLHPVRALHLHMDLRLLHIQMKETISPLSSALDTDELDSEFELDPETSARTYLSEELRLQALKFAEVDRWQMEKAQSPSKPFLQRVAKSKWIPFRHLSDQEYREMLSEKLLSVEAEIALLDEKIEDLEKTRPNSAPKPPNGKS